jgi:hypothetical protein
MVSLMIKTKLPAVLSLVALSFAFLGSFGLFTEAWAIENCNNVCESGHTKCNIFCDSNNNIGGEKWKKCLAQCDKYWYSGKNPQSIGRSDPHPSEPPRKVDPGKLKTPPTTVSNPNSPQPPLQIREKKK